MTTPDTAAGLRDWARGMHTTTAAAELLIRAFGGRFAGAGQSWIKFDESCDRHWIDVDALWDGMGTLSGGERRVLTVVAALLDEEPINITDVVSGVDREHLALILAAFSHAGGSHEGSELVVSDGKAAVIGLSALYPWPDSQ